VSSGVVGGIVPSGRLVGGTGLLPGGKADGGIGVRLALPRSLGTTANATIVATIHRPAISTPPAPNPIHNPERERRAGCACGVTTAGV
jgi:hypothetical protein